MREGWTYKKIGDLCDIATGKLDANAANENGMYPFFTCSKDPLSINTYAYDCECVLIAGNGDLNVKYYNGKFNAYQRTYILSLKEEIDGTTMPYIYNFFLLYVNELRRKSIGGIIKYIKLGDLANANIPVPSLSEQQSIVVELDKINELISLKKAQLSDLDNLAQSIFYDMFSDPIENEKGWGIKALGTIADFKNGLNFSKEESGNCYKFLGVSDFQDNRIVCSDALNDIHLNDSISNEYLLQTGDIVFVRSNGSKELVGRNILMHITEPTTFSGFCIRCRLSDDDFNSVYLSYLLKAPSMRPVITNSGRGCNISNLNQKILSSLPIIHPPLPLQQDFAKRIELIEQQKTQISSTIKDLETLLASRMQYWFD